MDEEARPPSPRRASKVSSHLLEPTKANIHGAYKKPSAEPDPRESKWSPHASKSTSPKATGEDRAPTPTKSPRKVKEVRYLPLKLSESVTWCKSL